MKNMETSSLTINNKTIEVENSIRKIVETLSKEIRNSYDYEKKLLAPINLYWNNIINSKNPQYELNQVEEIQSFWNSLAENNSEELCNFRECWTLIEKINN